MTLNSLTENEEQIVKTILGLHASIIFLDPNLFGF